jgi:dihydroorotase
MALMAHVFEAEGALGHLDAFACRNGAAFYGLPANRGTITLRRGPSPLPGPASVLTPEGAVTVFDPGFVPGWHVAEVNP